MFQRDYRFWFVVALLGIVATTWAVRNLRLHQMMVKTFVTKAGVPEIQEPQAEKVLAEAQVSEKLPVPEKLPVNTDAPEELSWVVLQKKVKDAVPQVFTQSHDFNWLEPYRAPEQSESCGSGFFINAQGDFITNYHVVAQAARVEIQIPSTGQERFEVEIVGVAPERDVALMRLTNESYEKIVKELGCVNYLLLGNSDEIQRGQEVLAVGYPLGQQYLKLTQGIISGRERLASINQSCFQISAAINPGNSGGPSINARGEVVGINFAGVPGAQNVGYIIPINEVKSALEDLYKTKLLRKPQLGALFESATTDMVNYYKNPEEGGFYVAHVFPDSLLSRGGLKAGDMVYSINGIKIDRYGDMVVPWSEDKISLWDLLNRMVVGDKLDILFYRQGIEQKASLKLEPRFLWPIRIMYSEFEGPIDYEVIAGIVVMDLTVNHIPHLMQSAPMLSRYLSPENQDKPQLVVTHIHRTSPAHKAKYISAGSIINKVNDQEVKTLAEFRKAVLKTRSLGFLKIELDDHRVVVMSLESILKEENRLSTLFMYKKSVLFSELAA